MLSYAVKCISLLDLIAYKEMKGNAYLWNEFGEQKEKKRRRRYERSVDEKVIA